jgi:hypothetical protein
MFKTKKKYCNVHFKLINLDKKIYLSCFFIFNERLYRLKHKNDNVNVTIGFLIILFTFFDS